MNELHEEIAAYLRTQRTVQLDRTLVLHPGDRVVFTFREGDSTTHLTIVAAEPRGGRKVDTALLLACVGIVVSIIMLLLIGDHP